MLLHGLTDDGACWSRVVAAWADSADLLIPDARGHGRSSRIGAGGFTVPMLARDVAGILDGLGIRDAVLFGHSMGAITATAVAADRPDLVRALVLEDPPLDVQAIPDDARRAEALAEIGRWGALDIGARHAAARSVHPEWATIETDAWADAKAAVDPAVADNLALFDNYEWRAVIGRLQHPGILLTGDPARGAIVTERVAMEAVRRWPAGRVVHVASAGHCIHRDRWMETMAAVRPFLEQQLD